MAAIASPQKRSVSLRVITETTETGANKYGTVSLGRISSSLNVSQNVTLIYNVADALATCLALTVGYVQAVSTDRLIDED